MLDLWVTRITLSDYSKIILVRVELFILTYAGWDSEPNVLVYLDLFYQMYLNTCTPKICKIILMIFLSWQMDGFMEKYIQTRLKFNH